LGFVLLQLGCTIPIYRLSIHDCPSAQLRSVEAATARRPPDHVSVRYLGVGGALFERCHAYDAEGACSESDVLLAAPLYTNPSLLEFMLDHEIHTDEDLVDRLLPKPAARAKGILVGHSHYDHLMDVPYIAVKHSKGATIYGSRTTQHLLASLEPELAGRPVVSLEDDAYDPIKGQAGRWVEVAKRIRVLALRSEHSDQMFLNLMGARMPFRVGRGRVSKDTPEPPRRASEWVQGSVFAYLIDFLDDAGQPVFRAYYQDSGADAGLGVPPDDVGLVGRKRVDVALLCAGGEFERLRNHPGAVLERLKPRFTILTHWEDFFVPQTDYCVTCEISGLPATQPSFLGRHLKKSHTERFLSRVEAARKAGWTTQYWLPCPTRSHFALPTEGSGAAVEATSGCYECPADACPHTRGCARRQ
jgi:hypothetical protein